MGISTNSVAYKIGFSSAIKEGTISAYNEMARWEFVGENKVKNKLKRSFMGGYAAALKLVFEVRHEVKKNKQNA